MSLRSSLDGLTRDRPIRIIYSQTSCSICILHTHTHTHTRTRVFSIIFPRTHVDWRVARNYELTREPYTLARGLYAKT